MSVPTPVASKGKYISGLSSADFHLTDNDRNKEFTVDTYDASLSVVVAAQIDWNVRAYLPFLSRVGNLIEYALVAEHGEVALLTYNDEVVVEKSFENGDLGEALRKIKASGHGTRMIDAAVQAIDLLASRPVSHSRVLVLIGQPIDAGSKRKLRELLAKAEESNVQIYTLELPLFGRAFVSDSFNIHSLPDQSYRGGYQASTELTRVIPVLRQAAKTDTGEIRSQCWL